jgi:DNA-binding transcriptional LysR family regulator
VSIASIGTAAEQVLLPLLGRFRRDYSDVDVTVDVGNRATVWEALATLTVDLVVAGRPPSALRTQVLGLSPNTLVLFGLSDRPIPRRAVQRALGSATWLLREQGSGTREATEELLVRLDIDPPRMILGSNGAILEAVCAGFGVAVMPAASVNDSFVTRGVTPIACPGTPMERPWHLVASAEVQMSPTVQLAVRSLIGGQGGFQPTGQGKRLVQSSPG